MEVECEKDCGCDVKHEYVHNDNSDTHDGERKIGAITMHRTQARFNVMALYCIG